MIQFILAVVGSWTASVLVFPALPFQHWLNSKLRSIWGFVRRRPVGLAGRWLASFRLDSNGHVETRKERVTVRHMSGGELRGKIRDRETGRAYCFLGRVLFDEVVGHYWSVDKSRDIGTFKFKKDHEGKVLFGPLTVYDTRADETTAGIDYVWHYLPPWIIRRFRPVRSGRSLVDGTGLFANDEFTLGALIGELPLGPSKTQGKHTISFGGQHREVKKPWCFLNHSCRPNARLELGRAGITLKARTHIWPQTELTIDYRDLPEPIGVPFECRCRDCLDRRQHTQIGGTHRAGSTR